MMMTSFTQVKPGSHMPPSYPRHSCRCCLRHRSDMRTESLRQQRPCQSSPPACLRLEFNFAGMPAVKTCDVSCCRRRYVLTCRRSIAGIKLGSHMPPMLPATSVLISEQYPRQYRRPCRSYFGGI